MSIWIPLEHFSKGTVYIQQDFAWSKLSNPDLRGTRLLKIGKNADKSVRLYQLNSWIIEELKHNKGKEFNDLED
ncbi:hypothetical protein OMCYN_01801 [cyanobiont of Ornithocercus magnificus]|nr:hypothetical protein OMCYN_01801 [cyanobiont of Ornithocercus magnificus]